MLFSTNVTSQIATTGGQRILTNLTSLDYVPSARAHLQVDGALNELLQRQSARGGGLAEAVAREAERPEHARGAGF